MATSDHSKNEQVSRLYETDEQLKIVCSDFVFVMSLWFLSLDMYFLDVRLGGPPDASCTCGHGNCVERWCRLSKVLFYVKLQKIIPCNGCLILWTVASAQFMNLFSFFIFFLWSSVSCVFVPMHALILWERWVCGSTQVQLDLEMYFIYFYKLCCKL